MGEWGEGFRQIGISFLIGCVHQQSHVWMQRNHTPASSQINRRVLIR
jgi:hypothetical protein